MHVTKIVRFDWSAVFESFWHQQKLSPNRTMYIGKVKVKSKVLIIYIAVLRNLGLLQDRFNNTPLIIGPIHGSYKQRLSI